MTTIAITETHVAADSLSTRGDVRVDKVVEKIKIAHGKIFGLAGDGAAFDALIAWWKKGALLEAVPKYEDAGWRLLVVDAKSIVSYSHDCPFPDPSPFPYAIGSGAKFAMAALRLGKSAQDAVVLASSFDIYTGGPIQVIEIASLQDKIKAVA